MELLDQLDLLDQLVLLDLLDLLDLLEQLDLLESLDKPLIRGQPVPLGLRGRLEPLVRLVKLRTLEQPAPLE